MALTRKTRLGFTKDGKRKVYPWNRKPKTPSKTYLDMMSPAHVAPPQKRKVYPWANKPKAPQPMRQKAPGRSADEARYSKAKATYMDAHKSCEMCPKLTLDAPARSSELHHKRGRAGSLLWDKRFFMAACNPCHTWVHNYPNKARALGLLAPAALWNVVPRGKDASSF